MPGRDHTPLTEPMYYILLSLLNQARCGTEIAEYVGNRTKGRVRLGPGTLYALLAKFEGLNLIREANVEGRKRTYCITAQGRAMFDRELARLRACVNDGGEAFRCKPRFVSPL